MAFKKITAIVRESQTDAIREQLQMAGITGMSVSTVRGYGEYENDYSRDGLVEHIKIEIFVDETQVDRIVQTIMDEGHTGLSGDGIVAISDLDDVYRIRTRSKLD